MKRKRLCLGLLLGCLGMNTAFGVSDPEGVPWGEWRFLQAFDGAGEIRADKASSPGSLIRANATSTGITQSDGTVIFAQTGPGDYLRVDVDDLAENGEGTYVNEYTMIFDIKTAQNDWLPLYNTNYDNQNEGDLWINGDGAVGSGTYSDPGVVPLNTWVRLVVVRTLEGGSWVRDLYVDGVLILDNLSSEGSDGNSSLYTNAQQDDGQFTIISDSDGTAYAGCELANFAFVGVALSSQEIADLGVFNKTGIYGASASGAYQPSPKTEAVDILRDTVLSWSPGVFSGTHDVYFGTSHDDVNEASRANAMTVQLAEAQDANTLDPGRLEFGTTYYWRVDEVNATADRTIFKGTVWSFTAEPYSILIPGSEIMATASSSSDESSIPEKTIDGSGLGEDNTHTIQSETMWFTQNNDLAPWIQYEFDGLKKLDTMRIWNSNSSAEGFVGYGVKGVQIQSSKDGQTWETFEDVNEFSQASGLPTYDQYDEIMWGGLAAKMVRLNIESNWGGFMKSYSLSEVQFTMIPAAARTPIPASGATDILPDDVVSWRSGRHAAHSLVYVSTDPNEVADGLVASVASNTNSLDLSAFDLQLGETYYWRVDEVNNAEAESVWAGPVWGFSTVAAWVVDDFEGYGNDSPDRPFQAWLDGFGFSADEFLPAGYGGNGTGAGIGHDIWSVASEHYNGNIMEATNTLPDSHQSMPFNYNNTNGTASQTDRTWSTPQDWEGHGIETLVLHFFGSEENTGGPIFVKINGQKVLYPETANLSQASWHPWNIDLASLGINLNAVTSMSMGVEGSGSGMILIDDILLYRDAPEIVSGLTTYGFHDMPDGGDAIEGLHGGIDFGTGSWWGGDSWYGTTKCMYFYDNFVNIDMSFTLPSNTHLYNITISANGAYSYTISDGINADIQGTTGTTPEIIATNWTSGGRTITISSAGGWNVVFDDITYKTSN